MRCLRLVMLAVVLFTLAAAPGAAQVSTPDVSALPQQEAPFGLSGSALPDDADAIEALFGRLPETVAGETARPLERQADRLLAAYGEADPMVGAPLMLGAISFADGDFFPTDFTAGVYVAMASSSSDTGAEGFGRDGDLAWLQATTTVSAEGDKPGTPVASRPLHTLAWGELDGGWLFTAAADTPEGLEALVEAFVAATEAES